MKTKVYIQNLKCGGCQKTIIDSLTTMEGIRDIVVSQEDASVSFKYATLKGVQEVINALSKLGYPAREEQNSLLKKATSYVSCAVGKLK